MAPESFLCFSYKLDMGLAGKVDTMGWTKRSGILDTVKGIRIVNGPSAFMFVALNGFVG